MFNDEQIGLCAFDRMVHARSVLMVADSEAMARPCIRVIRTGVVPSATGACTGSSWVASAPSSWVIDMGVEPQAPRHDRRVGASGCEVSSQSRQRRLSTEAMSGAYGSVFSGPTRPTALAARHDTIRGSAAPSTRRTRSGHLSRARHRASRCTRSDRSLTSNSGCTRRPTRARARFRVPALRVHHESSRGAGEPKR